MKILNQLALSDRVAYKLEELVDFVKIDAILDAYKVRQVPFSSDMDHEKYINARLKDIDINLLIHIAQEELDMDINDLLPTSAKPNTPPVKKEIDSSPMIGFISYEHTDVDYANRLNKILEKYNIHAFVAYRNTREGEPFQPDIITALNEMTFFISIHTESFSKSPYCQQEVGFALARDVKIIPIKLGKDPDGFIKGITAIVQNAQNLDIITPRILKMLAESPKTKDLYSAKVADKVKDPKKIDVKAYTLTMEDLIRDSSMEVEPLVAILSKLRLLGNEVYHLPALQGRNHAHKFTISTRDKILENYPLDMEDRTEKIKEIHKKHREDIKERYGR